MSTLKGLTFTKMPVAGSDPVVERRTRVVDKLEEQKSLARDANHKRVVRRRVKEGGETKLVEKPMRIQPWWKDMPDGSVAFGIRLGKIVEFSPGNTAVTAASLEKLPGVIDQLISAIRVGELDKQLASASVGPQKKVKK
jgi:hypothetical protein